MRPASWQVVRNMLERRSAPRSARLEPAIIDHVEQLIFYLAILE
jgi:hypothetical protein